MKSPRIIAVANQKGGVGKTTTAINLGTALAAIGEQTLIVDIDPQGNASTGLGVDRSHRRASMFELLIGDATLSNVIHKTAIPNLSLAPSSMDLLGLEMMISGKSDRLQRLKQAIHSHAVRDVSRETFSGFDYILIDCPPSLNLLTLNALMAASAVIVPLQCEFFALEGLSQLVETVDHVKQTMNANLAIGGIVLTMFDKRNNLCVQVANDVRRHFGETVYETVIPRNVRLSEAPSYGKPALLYDLQCSGSQAYLRLASEILRKERQLNAA